MSLVENFRGKMKQFWESLLSGGEPGVEQMIQYQHAAAINKLEIPEVLSLLPDIEKKDILELGAGIGQVLHVRPIYYFFCYFIILYIIFIYYFVY